MKKRIISFFVLAVVAISLSSCFYHGHRDHNYRHHHHEDGGHHEDHGHHDDGDHR